MGKTRNSQELSSGSQFENYDVAQYTEVGENGYTEVLADMQTTSTDLVEQYKVKKVYDSVERKKVLTKRLNKSFSRS